MVSLGKFSSSSVPLDKFARGDVNCTIVDSQIKCTSTTRDMSMWLGRQRRRNVKNRRWTRIIEARKESEPQDWSAIIRERIEAEGWSTADLAAFSGVNHAQLSRFLSGQRSLTLRTAQRLCHALGLTLTGEETPEDCATQRAFREEHWDAESLALRNEIEQRLRDRRAAEESDEPDEDDDDDAEEDQPATIHSPHKVTTVMSALAMLAKKNPTQDIEPSAICELIGHSSAYTPSVIEEILATLKADGEYDRIIEEAREEAR
jgi:transcriptional regulator with XRE-family HTH domain